jgi:hypothetical protein
MLDQYEPKVNSADNLNCEPSILIFINICLMVSDEIWEYMQ